MSVRAAATHGIEGIAASLPGSSCSCLPRLASRIQPLHLIRTFLFVPFRIMSWPYQRKKPPYPGLHQSSCQRSTTIGCTPSSINQQIIPQAVSIAETSSQPERMHTFRPKTLHAIGRLDVSTSSQDNNTQIIYCRPRNTCTVSGVRVW
ncbi:unnamed protein product, partial [Ectocarpus sp. 12 AP-2014]